MRRYRRVAGRLGESGPAVVPRMRTGFAALLGGSVAEAHDAGVMRRILDLAAIRDDDAAHAPAVHSAAACTVIRTLAVASPPCPSGVTSEMRCVPASRSSRTT